MLQVNQLHKSFPQVAQPVLKGVTFTLNCRPFGGSVDLPANPRGSAKCWLCTLRSEIDHLL